MFRPAVDKDVEAIASIYNEIFDAEEKGLLTTGWIRGIYPTRKTAQEAIDAREMIVEDIQGTIVASGRINTNQMPECAMVSWKYDAGDMEVLVLHTLTVSRKAEGRGYGTEFIRYYEKMAAERGAPAVRIDTNAKNRNARRLYAYLGYREAGVVQTVFNGIPNVSLVLLEKKILPFDQNR